MPVYLTLQPIRRAALHLTVEPGRLLPYLFTLTYEPKLDAGGYFLSRFLHSRPRLPVKKYGALCCPDFPQAALRKPAGDGPPGCLKVSANLRIFDEYPPVVAKNPYFCTYMRITASQRKLIASLSSARRRRETGLFAAEGIRCLSELLPTFRLRYLVVTSTWIEANSENLRQLVGNDLPDEMILVAKHDELAKMSSMKTPQGVMAVFELPEELQGCPEIGQDDLVLALDRIQDPGNLGTIIRVADWFGVHTILASEETVDVFNPKVLQSTMGALARVKVYYCNLADTLKDLSDSDIAVYGTFLGGSNLYSTEFGKGGIIVMGNEGNGISPEVAAQINNRITIPSYPADAQTVESLNVGTAAAVTIAEFRRQAMAKGLTK